MEGTRKSNPEKNEQIRSSLLETKKKRESQVCRVFKIKIQDNRLKDNQREALKMVFVEAKWLVNNIINWSEQDENKIWNFKIGDTVIHKDKDMNDIESPFKFLGSQMKQSILTEMLSNIKTLSTLKRRNKQKPGRLKYRSEVKSINLKQYGTTYKIHGKNKISIQKIPGKLHVNGLDQISKDYEFANAKLMNTPKGLYIALTCFIDKNKVKQQTYVGEEIGLDFGCSTTLTLSNGIKFNVCIQESERLKKLQRKLAKQERHSKGRRRTIDLIRIEYEKLNNRKNDAANKIVHEILKYEHVYMQDENLTGWKIRFGKTIQHSVLGRLKEKLKPKATYVLNKFEPTTKMCYHCGQVHDMPLSKRIYECDCGIPPEDRDIHAAKNMIVLSKIRLGLEPAELTRVDIDPRDSG